MVRHHSTAPPWTVFVWPAVVWIFPVTLAGISRQDSSRNGTSSAGERRKGRVTGACTAWRSTPGWRQTPSAESLSGQLGLNGETTFNNLLCHSETDSRNHFYNSSSVVFFFFFLEPLKHSQPVWYYGLMMKHGSNQWVWGASKMALEKQHHLTVAPVRCQSAVDRLISGTWW